MAQPFARVLGSIGIVRRLIHHLHLHFIDSDARTSVIRDVKVASEGTQLLELEFIDHRVLPVCHRELEHPVLATSEIFNLPLNTSFRQVKIG